MTTTTRSLTIEDVTALGTIADWCRKGTNIRFILPQDDDTNRVQTGIVRHFVVSPDDFNFFRGDDVRDAFVRVTTRNGGELAIPVEDLVGMISAGGVGAAGTVR